MHENICWKNLMRLDVNNAQVPHSQLSPLMNGTIWKRIVYKIYKFKVALKKVPHCECHKFYYRLGLVRLCIFYRASNDMFK
jgi:hypothetical protein